MTAVLLGVLVAGAALVLALAVVYLKWRWRIRRRRAARVRDRLAFAASFDRYPDRGGVAR